MQSGLVGTRASTQHGDAWKENTMASRKKGTRQSAKTAKKRSQIPSLSRRHHAPRPSSLSPSQLKIRADVLAAHAEMLRDRKLTASPAAKDHGLRVHDFWKYIPKAFKKDSSRRIRAVPDRYVRAMEILGADGPIVIKIRGSKARSDMARFRNDFFAFLGGDASALDKWKGVKIQGHDLLTDPGIIRLLG